MVHLMVIMFLLSMSVLLWTLYMLFFFFRQVMGGVLIISRSSGSVLIISRSSRSAIVVSVVL